MPRNRIVAGVTATDRKVVHLASGVDIGTPYSDSYTHQVVNRPDSVSSPKLKGFRKPTSWNVLDTSGTPFAIGQWSWTQFGYRYTYTGASAGVITSFTTVGTPLPSTNASNRAEVQALLKIKSQKVNLSVAAAEMRKSVNMIAQRTGTLYKAVKAAKRGNFLVAAQTLGIKHNSRKVKDVASGWLELQYGWMPLLQDIEGAYKLTTQKLLDYGMIITAKSSVTEKYEERLNAPSLSPPFVASCSRELNMTAKCTLSYRVDSVAMNFAAQAGLDNPLTVAWELTPFSFLVDWLIPVGNLLDAFTATQGLTFMGGSLTRVTRGVQKNVLLMDGSMQSFGAGFGEVKLFRMERTTYSSTPFPLPYYKNPFSVMHGLNGLALLISILKK